MRLLCPVRLSLLRPDFWTFHWVSGRDSGDSGIRWRVQRAWLCPRPGGAPTLTLSSWRRAHTIPQRWGTTIPWDPQHVIRILEKETKREAVPVTLLSFFI